ncbi:type II toxin-antitoxin system VapC family toxin [Coleofasciculus sp. E2-BRE-01]|uniref:type II toxin-antitoxin system VapC family toxin n=1 Tax=Coleofasciculus sp. E2-BRE-01 TaxID=3069524 RepID=UPI0032F4A31D
MGQLNLPDSSRIYIDTVVMIYAVEQASVYGSLLADLWAKVQAGNLEVLTSELTLMEVLVIPIRNSDTFLTDAYKRLLRSPQIQLVSINQLILEKAARLRAITPSLRTPDSIHIATAITSGCNQFLTNDQRLRIIPDLPVVILDEVLSS